MTVAGVVMAHKQRRNWAEDLSDRLGIPIVWDRINDRHDTGLRCLKAGLDAPSHVTHWLVVQDDAIVCRDLLAGLEVAVSVSGDRIVGLYIGNVRPHTGQVGRRVEQANAREVSWLAMPGPWWGVGIVIPTVHLTSLVDRYSKSRDQNYDRRIEKWAASAKVECWYTNPSLVEHRHGDENPSLVPNRGSTTRRARRFIGAGASALDVDWTRTPPLETGVWRNLRTSRVARAKPGTTQATRYETSGQWEPVVESRCGECGGRKYEPIIESEHEAATT